MDTVSRIVLQWLAHELVRDIPSRYGQPAIVYHADAYPWELRELRSFFGCGLYVPEGVATTRLVGNMEYTIARGNVAGHNLRGMANDFSDYASRWPALCFPVLLCVDYRGCTQIVKISNATRQVNYTFH